MRLLLQRRIMVRPPRDSLGSLIEDELADIAGGGVGGRGHSPAHPSPAHLEGRISRSLGSIDRRRLVDPAMRLPTRVLGKTGREVTILGLGGEGVLRTTGREREARIVIETALETGVNYFDTAPAYDGSVDYLGGALRDLRPTRSDLFIASKTHDRTYDGSMRLLEATLRRLGTDYLDLWQLHDLGTASELSTVFRRDGALEAIEEAKRSGIVRHVGLTGHYDPNILLQAMRFYPFDTVLMPLNVGDRHHLPFATTVLPEARVQGMGVIAMKVAAKGSLPVAGFSMKDLFDYTLSQNVHLAVVGCDNQRNVERNVVLARSFAPMLYARQHALEARVGADARLVAEANHFKRGYAPAR